MSSSSRRGATKTTTKMKMSNMHNMLDRTMMPLRQHLREIGRVVVATTKTTMMTMSSSRFFRRGGSSGASTSTTTHHHHRDGNNEDEGEGSTGE